jgi:hypothetical protein
MPAPITTSGAEQQDDNLAARREVHIDAGKLIGAGLCPARQSLASPAACSAVPATEVRPEEGRLPLS